LNTTFLRKAEQSRTDIDMVSEMPLSYGEYKGKFSVAVNMMTAAVLWQLFLEVP
jgi:hypothetical protein